MSTTADWHKEACAEASVTLDSAILTNMDATQAVSHAAKAVLARLDRLGENGTLCRLPLADVFGKQC